MIKLNDVLAIADINNVKIRLNLSFGEKDSMEVFESGDISSMLEGHYWNYSKNKSYKLGQVTIGLLKMKPNENLWLLFHVGKITNDLNILDACGYEYEHLTEYKKYLGRIVVKYKNTSQNMIRNAESLIDDCEIYEILPANTFDNEMLTSSVILKKEDDKNKSLQEQQNMSSKKGLFERFILWLKQLIGG